MIHNLFFRAKIPGKIPKEYQKVISNIKKSSKNKYEFLRKSYNFLAKKYLGVRLNVKYAELFGIDLKKVWKKKIVFCTTMNYLLRLFLIKSGMFTEKDIRTKWSFIWFLSPHHYLQVKVSRNKWINADLWGQDHGIKFGDYAREFH